MDDLTIDSLAAVFRALSDPTRLRIVNLLAGGEELCVCDIESVLELPQARVSQHLSVLRSAGLVTARRRAVWMHYSLRKDALQYPALQALLLGEQERVEQLRRDAESMRSGGCCRKKRS